MVARLASGKLNHPVTIKISENSQVTTEVDDGAQGTQRLHAHEDGTLSVVQRVDLQLSRNAIGPDHQARCAQASILGGVAKGEGWRVHRGDFLQAASPMLAAVLFQDRF